MHTFQKLIQQLTAFWEKEGCSIHHGYDLETGAGTFNPVTFLRCLGPEPYHAAYVEPSRRPTDGRYGENPNRVQHFHQYQVILKPSPADIQNAYIRSLEAVGLDLSKHDIRFVHDDWESPTLGAWGLGWETWIDGQEVSQITYFQCVAGVELRPVTGEITYGLERLAMYLQGVDSIFNLQWDDNVTYGEIYHRNEVEWSSYNFEKADASMWLRHFNDFEKEAQSLVAAGLPLPAYDFVAKASHAFNLLDARGVISVTERTGYIGRIRDLSKKVAEKYIESRKTLGFPLLKKSPPKEIETLSTLPMPSFPVDARQTFLLEIGSEELPATFVPRGLQSLERLLKDFLDKEEIAYSKISCHGTPRRLAIVIEDLLCGTAASKEKRRGPPLNRLYDGDGKVTATGEGFFRSLALSPLSLEELQQDKTGLYTIEKVKEVDYLFVEIQKESRATAELLSEKLPQLIAQIDFQKKMRWADLDVTYARPVLWIVAMMGGQVIPFTFGTIVSSSISYGHRQLSPASFSIDHADHYVELLRRHQVMVDLDERTKAIEEQLKNIEDELGVRVLEKDRVLPEVLNLIEWPFVCYATFDEKFLKAPAELLISEMVEHQRYFPVANKNGSLVNIFIITANNTPSEQIQQGNCNVLSARLHDGVFLYEQDLKKPLTEMAKKLEQITFQKDLGTLHDKSLRLVAHTEKILPYVAVPDPRDALKAASLCKADLASQVVYEFPLLQGIMGRYYALAAGESLETALAIEEHWMPISEKGSLPKTLTGCVLSIADKIDNLLGYFSVGLKPSSSSDPYALRRQVLGLIRLLLEHRLRVPLNELLGDCYIDFPKADPAQKKTIVEEIINFIGQRIRTVFQDYGFKKDEIEASISFGFNDIYDVFSRVEALHAFRKSAAFFPLYETFRRARGQIHEFPVGSVNPTFLQEKAEKGLYQYLEETQITLEHAIARQDYHTAYLLLSEIQPHLVKLFEEVRILAEDEVLQRNRISLLQAVFALFEKLLDFNQLQEKVVTKR